MLLIGSGGAPLSANNKRALLECLPDITIMDGIGSSETGAQAMNPSNKGTEISTGDFTPLPGSCVVSEDLTRVLAAGDAEIGWFTQRGRVPLGYLGDAEKTARTFPEIDGVRYSVPGDRARIRADGSFEVPGRDSVTINSGGEKIFAEEAEAAVAEVVVASELVPQCHFLQIYYLPKQQQQQQLLLQQPKFPIEFHLSQIQLLQIQQQFHQ